MLKFFLLPLYFVLTKSWAVDYQNKFKCVEPTYDQVMMGGRTKIQDIPDISITYKDNLGNIINSFSSTLQEVNLEIVSKVRHNILFDVSQGKLNTNNVKNSILECNNKRIYTTDRSNTWNYKWVSDVTQELKITFTYIDSKDPIYLVYFRLPYNNELRTTSYSPNTSTILPITSTTNLPTSLPTLPNQYNNYKIIQYNSIIFGWYLQDDIISIISQTRLPSCSYYFSIAFTREYGQMTGADAIFGWGDEMCKLNIDAFFLPEESKVTGQSIYNYHKNNYLLTRSISYINNIMTIEFSRKINTGNQSDIQLNNITNIIYAMGDKMDPNTVSYHYEDDTFNFDLYYGNIISKNVELYNHLISFIIFGIFFFWFLCSIIVIHNDSLYFLYRTFNKYVNLKYLGVYSIGNIFFIFLYIFTWITFLIYSFISTKKEEIISRLGIWISFNFAFTLLPIFRNNITVVLLKIPQTKMIDIHKIIALFTLISVIIKLVVCVILTPQSLFVTQYGGTNPLMGMIASILTIVLSSLSIKNIRENIFELFYYSHKILSVSIIITSSLHSIITLYYLIPSIILYFIDFIIRLFKIRKTIYSNFKNFKSENDSYTFFKIITDKPVKTRAGCYFLICFNKISKLEWHSLSLISNTNNTLSFCVKNNGKTSWSNKLYKYIENIPQNINLNKEIFIQGPYNCLSINYHKYKQIIMIAGGIGITPMISILEEIVIKEHLKINLIWIIKKNILFDEFKNILSQYLYNENLNINIYLTDEKIDSEGEKGNLEIITNIHTYYEKPNIHNILITLLDLNNFEENVLISCGPEKLIKDVKNFASENKIDLFNESFSK